MEERLKVWAEVGGLSLSCFHGEQKYIFFSVLQLKRLKLTCVLVSVTVVSCSTDVTTASRWYFSGTSVCINAYSQYPSWSHVVITRCHAFALQKEEINSDFYSFKCLVNYTEQTITCCMELQCCCFFFCEVRIKSRSSSTSQSLHHFLTSFNQI